MEILRYNKRVAVNKVTSSCLYVRTKLKSRIMSVSTYWTQFRCKSHLYKYCHIHSIISANMGSTVPIVSHPSIMPSNPIYYKRDHAMIHGSRRVIFLLREPHYLIEMWIGARYQNRDMRKGDGIMHEIRQGHQFHPFNAARR